MRCKKAILCTCKTNRSDWFTKSNYAWTQQLPPTVSQYIFAVTSSAHVRRNQLIVIVHKFHTKWAWYTLTLMWSVSCKKLCRLEYRVVQKSRSSSFCLNSVKAFQSFPPINIWSNMCQLLFTAPRSLYKKSCSYCWESLSQCIVSNSRAACWRWLFQTWKFWRFAYSQYIFNVFMGEFHGINVYGSRGAEFENIGSVQGLKVLKLCSQGPLPVHLFSYLCCRMYRSATIHFFIDSRQTALSCQ